MGYDCTLHLISEKAIREEFVPRLLRRSHTPTMLDRVIPDADELWDTVHESLTESDPDEAASLLCQLAVKFSACSLQHQYQRGFALCLWEDQGDGLAVDFPSEYAFSPEPMFAEVVKEFPHLHGRFPTWFTENYSTGVFIPAERVPEVLAWVESKIATMKKGNRRHFKGLLGILRAAADQRLAYWEATDLAVPIAGAFAGDPDLMIAKHLGNEPGVKYRLAEEAPLSANFRSLGCEVIDGWLVSSDYNPVQTNFWDLNTWPPSVMHTRHEYAPNVAHALDGRWLLFFLTDPAARPVRFRPHLFRHLDNEPEQLLPVIVNGIEMSVRAGGFVGDRILVFQEQYPGANVGKLLLDPLWWECKSWIPLPGLRWWKRKGWRPVPGLPHGTVTASASPHLAEDPVTGLVTLSDGSTVVIWDGNGYELRGTRFKKTFSMQAKSSCIEWTSMPAGADGFYYLSERKLFEVHRNANPIAHTSTWTNIMLISAGPAGGIVLKEGENDDGDLGKLYFPADGTFIHIEHELFDDDSPPFIYWSKTTDRFVVCSEKFRAVSTATVLSLQRYRVSDGKKVK